MKLKTNELILAGVVLIVFILYGVALVYSFKTGKPIPDDLNIFVRASMGAAGVAITRLLLTVGKNNGDSDDSSNPDGK